MKFTQKINFQRLLDEKNQELETLRQQYHSTPQPQSWSSRLTLMFYSQLILDHPPCLIQYLSQTGGFQGQQCGAAERGQYDPWWLQRP